MSCCCITLSAQTKAIQSKIRNDCSHNAVAAQGNGHLWDLATGKTYDCYLAAPFQGLQGFSKGRATNRVKDHIHACRVNSIQLQ